MPPLTWRLRIWPNACAATSAACATITRNATPAAVASTAEYVIAPQVEDDSDDTPAADNPVIIAENQTVIENLSVSEAVMRMDLADAPAFVFRNSKHGGLGVVYRRGDGNIGWIDTPASEA